MAEGTTAIDLALTTEGDADGSDLIELETGALSPAPAPEGPLQYIDNHEERGVRQLAPPFWGKPHVAAVLQSVLREIQLLEDTLWEMLELRTLEGADLPRLKVLGKIVGQPRLSFDTETYRTVIEARARANVSRGRAIDLLEVLTLLLGEQEFVLLAVGNATLYVTAEESQGALELAMVRAVLPDTRAAGVGLQFFYSDDAENMFLWGDEWGSPEEWGTVEVL
jgi:hypothetical protein